jgi:hypothetical protein
VSPGRRLRLALVVLAGIALAAPAHAAARTTGDIDQTIRVGDLVDVVGTKVGCFAARASGKVGIVCAHLDRNGPIPKTYAAAIRVDGAVYGYVITAGREPKRIFERMPQVAESPLVLDGDGRTYELGVGKTFALAGTRLACQIVNVTSGVAPVYKGIKVGCFRATPGGYGIAVSDRFAGIFRFKRNGEAGANVFVKLQPRTL